MEKELIGAFEKLIADPCVTPFSGPRALASSYDGMPRNRLTSIQRLRRAVLLPHPWKQVPDLGREVQRAGQLVFV